MEVNKPTELQPRNFISSWIKSPYKSHQLYQQLLKVIPVLPQKKTGKSLSIYRSDDGAIQGFYIKFTDESNSTISYNREKKTLYVKENKQLKDQIDDIKLISAFLDVFQANYQPIQSKKKVQPSEV